ncbi:MAG: PD-(D/E)XK nuclease family protein [Sulfolobales archaeon]
MSLNEFKQKILTLLREDEEFRYAVAGLIGLTEILRELRELRRAVHEQGEILRTLQEAVVRHEKTIQSLQEVILRHEKIIQSLQETIVRHERAILSLQEAVKSLAETVAKQGEAIERQGRAIESLQESVRDLSRTVAAIGRRYGVVTEEAFREAIKYLIEDLLKTYKVTRWTYLDSEGVVHGAPSIIEIDVLIRDYEHILVEYKAYADRGDVAELHRIGILYEKILKIKPRLLIVAASISRRAYELAKNLGIEVRAGEISE